MKRAEVSASSTRIDQKGRLASNSSAEPLRTRQMQQRGCNTAVRRLRIFAGEHY